MEELMKTYPKTAIVVKQWLLGKMLESLNNESIPEEFKEHVRQEGITDEYVVKLLANQPRALFDVFDEHKVYIEINVTGTLTDPKFLYALNYRDQKEADLNNNEHSSRREAEYAAIEEAFKVLNDKL